MKRVLLFMVLGVLCTGAVQAQLVRRPLVLDTMLVDQGVPKAMIVTPVTPEYNALAKRVQSAIREASGANLPIRNDSAFAKLRGELTSTPDRNVVLIGNQDGNGLVRYLCSMGYCSVDTVYPGKGGYVIKTIHDPWANGANVILLAGSDMQGISNAVDAFLELLPKGASLTIPRIFLSKLSPEARETSPKLAIDPSDADVAKEVKDTETAFRNGVQGGVFNPITYAGNNYAMSGNEGYARLFRELVFLAERLSKEGQGPFGGPWGAAADFLFAPFITAWDNVEESPSLSDADRQHIATIIVDYIHYWEDHGYTRGMATPVIRTNHYTFEGQGYLAAGQYFKKYYAHPEAEKWLQLADSCFQTQMKSFMPQEDCGGYQWITARHMCRYATTRQDFSWFDSGKAKILGDLSIMETDNLGYHLSFGDVGGFSPGSQLGVWPYFVAVTRDGRYVWAIQKARQALGLPGTGGLANNTPPAEPTDLLGVKWVPTDPLFYDCWKGKNQAVSQEKTLEKVAFRTSFDPDKPYMILDGINGCYHGHYDGNSILRFTDRERIWLADSDYIKSLPKFHNTMLVLKDGQASLPPIFCQKEVIADLDRVGLSSTTTPNYAGADWTRNILWNKGRTFVFIDEVRPLTTDDYSLRCCWQALGVPELAGNTFRVNQKGPSFSVRNLDGARLRYSSDPVIGANWKNYKHADPVVHTLQQIKAQRLPAGARVVFLNVLSTEAPGEHPVPAERVSDYALLVGTGDDQALVGVRGPTDAIVPWVTSDAQLYWIARRWVALGGATRISISGLTMQSDVPISAELSADGTAIIVADAPANVDVTQDSDRMALDGIRVPVPETGGTVTLKLAPGTHRITGMSIHGMDFPFPRPAPAGSAVSAASYTDGKTIVPAIQFRTEKGRLLALDADINGIYIGVGNKVQALTPDGRIRWEFDAGSEVRAVWVGKLEKDSGSRVAVGTVGAAVHLLDQSGKPFWKHELPFFKRTGSVVYFSSADLAGDGNRTLIVGAENWHAYALDPKGNQLWQFEILHAATAGTSVDLNGDGKEEVIVGTEYYQWCAVKPSGEMLWAFKPVGPHVNAVRAGNLASDGKLLVIFGGADSNIYTLGADGKKQWAYSAGDEITGLALTDLNGDGKDEIVAGSRGFDVLALKADGTRVWRRDLGEPVLALALADLDGDGSQEICAGTEDGHVVILGRDGKVLATWTASGPVRKLAVVPTMPAGLAVMDGDSRVVVLTW